MKKLKAATKATLNLHSSEVEASALKAAVLDKFGSLAQFCRISSRNLQQLIDYLKSGSPAAKQYLTLALSDARTLCNQPATGYHLTPILRSKLRAALGRSTVVEFCSTHTEFSTVFISRTLNGGTDKITPKVKKLAEVLKVNLTEKEDAQPSQN